MGCSSSVPAAADSSSATSNSQRPELNASNTPSIGATKANDAASNASISASDTPLDSERPGGARSENVVLQQEEAAAAKQAEEEAAKAEREAAAAKETETVAGGPSSTAGGGEFADYEDQLVSYAKSLSGGQTESAAAYAQGIGGTKEDSDAEKAFSKMMRDGDDSAGTGLPSPPYPVGEPGRWLRVLNDNSKCYLYIHTVSQQVTGTRPDDYVDEQEKEEVVEEEDPFKDHPGCCVDEWVAQARLSATSEGKTLLLCAPDGLREEILATAQREGHCIVDTRPFVLGPIKTKVKFPDAVENARQQLLAALKGGKILVIDVFDSTPDFKEKICGNAKYKQMFPQQVFDSKASGWATRALFKGDPDGPSRSEDYCSCVLTSLNPAEAAKELKAGLPFHQLKPFIVRAPAVQRVQMGDLETTVEEIIAQGRTPLLLDQSEHNIVDTFYGYQRSSIIEVARVGMQASKGPDGLTSALEAMRSKTAQALKHGNILLVRMGSCTVDISSHLTGADTFPPCSLQCGKLQLPEIYESLVRDEDREPPNSNGIFVVREGFKVIVTAQQSSAQYRQLLAGSLPLQWLQPVAVFPDE